MYLSMFSQLARANDLARPTAGRPEFAMLWLPETMNLLESKLYCCSMEYRCTAIVEDATVVMMHKHFTSTRKFVKLATSSRPRNNGELVIGELQTAFNVDSRSRETS